MCIMYILFVNSLWAALYNYIIGLAIPFRLEVEELKITWGEVNNVS